MLKLDSQVFRDAANIYLWDGKQENVTSIFSCVAIIRARHNARWLNTELLDDISCDEYLDFFEKHFKPKNATAGSWWQKGWRFWTQASVQHHRKKMLLKAADLVDKMNREKL